MRTAIDLNDATGFSDLPKPIASEPLWWGVAGLLSLAAVSLPNVIGMRPDPEGRQLVVVSALFLSGAVLGCFRPERAWRWALAAFIVIALRDLPLVSDTITKADLLRFLYYLETHVGVFLLQTLPVLVGSIFGAWTARKLL
jgi:hypothetical protein